jgi:hypothetical protein
VAEEQLMDNLVEIRTSWITSHIMENMGERIRVKNTRNETEGKLYNRLTNQLIRE